MAANLNQFEEKMKKSLSVLTCRANPPTVIN